MKSIKELKSLGIDFWKYLFGQFVSVVGDLCGYVAFSWWVLEQSSDAKALAFIMTPTMFFRIVLMPLFGPFGDRYARKKLLAIGEFWRGIICLFIVGMMFSGQYHLVALAALSSLLSVGTALYQSASTGVIPQLVPKDKVESAIQISQGVMSSGNILGGVIGGVLVATVGASYTYLIDAITFLIAGTLLISIKKNTVPETSTKQSIKAWYNELKEGFKILYKIKVLFRWGFLAMGLNFLFAPFGVVLPALIKEGKGMPAWVLGWVEMAGGIGAVIGTILVGKVLKKVPRAQLVQFSILAMGLSVATLPLGNNVFTLMLPMFCLTLFGTFCNVPSFTQIIIATPDQLRSRVMSIMAFLCQGVNPVGVAVVGVLMAKYGISETVIGMGVIFTGLSLLVPLVTDFFPFFNATKEKAATFFEERYGLTTDTLQQS